MRGLRWRLILLAGMLILFFTIVSVATVIALYSAYVYTIEPADTLRNTQLIEQFAAPAGNYGSLIFNLIWTYGLSSWVMRRAGTAVSLHGFLIGTLSGLGRILQAFLFASGELPSLTLPLLFTLFMFFPLSIAAATLGARRGYAKLRGQEQLYRASRAIQQAHTPQAIVSAIGNQLQHPQIGHVGLWEILLQPDGQAPTAVSPLAEWSSLSESVKLVTMHLSQTHLPSLDQLAVEEAVQVKVDQKWVRETAVWETLGIRSLMLLPLIAPSGHWVGLLVVGSRASRGLNRTVERDVQTIAAQVALTLDNMRLVARAKETGKLQERQRMAREIHDTLAQGFTSIVMHLEAAEQSLGNDNAITQLHLDQARQTARDSLGQARRVVDDLRPELLESAPLHEAIERVVRQWQTQTNIDTQFNTTGEIQPLHPEVEVTLLRGIQEALANVRKHARATLVSVTLSYLTNNVILDIEDNGVGFEAGKEKRDERSEKRVGNVDLISGGFGLLAMRERVAELGGEVTVESEAGEGTTLAISIPVGYGHYEA